MVKGAQTKAPVAAGIVFTGDFDFVEPTRTTAFRKGHAVANPSARLREAALASGKAVPDGEG